MDFYTHLKGIVFVLFLCGHSGVKGGNERFLSLSKFPEISVLRNSELEPLAPRQKLVQSSEEELKTILEERYRFRNDETSTRFKIAKEDRGAEWSESKKSDVTWAFRTYAVRRIVGGMETSISMYPYNVAISRNGKHWCGGAVIDEQWVLTAGHCLESAFGGHKNKLHPFVVRGGSSFHNRGGYQAKINKVFFPPDYVPGNADYDFSLLRLDRPMPIGRNIAVLNLPSRDFVIKSEDVLIVSGWGSTHETGLGHIPDRLRFVPVPVMPRTDCQHSYKFYITPRMLCAGYATGGKDACNHDSGGPAVREGVLLGIVSFGGKQCGDPRSPGVYSRVSEMTEWVETTIKKNEAHSVPELRKNIAKAREREQKLQRFKNRVEDKKDKIKTWLRETLRSPVFIELAKKKLRQAGFDVRRRAIEARNTSYLDDSSIDDINLSHLINERILQNGEMSEDEQMLSTLALKQIMMTDKLVDTESESFEDLFAYIIED